jgi:hypothetical protein
LFLELFFNEERRLQNNRKKKNVIISVNWLASRHLSYALLLSPIPSSLFFFHFLKNINILSINIQWRRQGRCQPAPGHPLGSLKNKIHAVKNDVFLTQTFYFLNPGTPTDRFVVRVQYLNVIRKYSDHHIFVVRVHKAL